MKITNHQLLILKSILADGGWGVAKVHQTRYTTGIVHRLADKGLVEVIRVDTVLYGLLWVVTAAGCVAVNESRE